jgi:flagellar hook protein FlgE
MASEVSTVQSLKAVDAWIDVINANVRTAFKSTRLKFSGSNVDVTRAGTSTSLPLQFPEPGLTTANTVVDFTQGAITASTENTHLAIQGDGFFLTVSPDTVQATGSTAYTAISKGLMTRDGEFRTDTRGLLINAQGYHLVVVFKGSATTINGGGLLTVYNDLDIKTPGAGLSRAVRLSDFLTNTLTDTTVMADGVSLMGGATLPIAALANVTMGKQNLQYSKFGSTIFDFGFNPMTGGYDPAINLRLGTTADATILAKSLEASNASMTQSVPELSLAQKLFSALTKVLQTKQTNVDGVLNLVR